jgi:hypothetical protein
LNIFNFQGITKSEAHFEHKRAPVLCIHVSFACNQQLAHSLVAITGSVMQSSILDTRTENQKQTSKAKNTTRNRKQILNINAHLSFAFTSAFPAISILHTVLRSLKPARCRAVCKPLEQNIRSKLQNRRKTQKSVTNF